MAEENKDLVKRDELLPLVNVIADAVRDSTKVQSEAQLAMQKEINRHAEVRLQYAVERDRAERALERAQMWFEYTIMSVLCVFFIALTIAGVTYRISKKLPRAEAPNSAGD